MTTPVMKKWKEDDVVCAAIGERTFQDSADWLNESLPKEYQITRQSVYNWCVGKHAAEHEFLNALIIFYQNDEDERRLMALKLLDMRREKMLAAHVVGKKMIKNAKVQA